MAAATSPVRSSARAGDVAAAIVATSRPTPTLRPSPDAWIIHAGTKERDEVLVTAGGRVLGAVGMAARLEAARGLAYGLLAGTHFEGLTYRRDIAARKD